nr:MAG TPA: hypothetical protein [Caudoviricetes sp.]
MRILLILINFLIAIRTEWNKMSTIALFIVAVCCLISAGIELYQQIQEGKHGKNKCRSEK